MQILRLAVWPSHRHILFYFYSMPAFRPDLSSPQQRATATFVWWSNHGPGRSPLIAGYGSFCKGNCDDVDLGRLQWDYCQKQLIPFEPRQRAAACFGELTSQMLHGSVLDFRQRPESNASGTATSKRVNINSENLTVWAHFFSFLWYVSDFSHSLQTYILKNYKVWRIEDIADLIFIHVVGLPTISIKALFMSSFWLSSTFKSLSWTHSCHLQRRIFSANSLIHMP